MEGQPQKEGRTHRGRPFMGAPCKAAGCTEAAACTRNEHGDAHWRELIAVHFPNLCHVATLRDRCARLPRPKPNPPRLPPLAGALGQFAAEIRRRDAVDAGLPLSMTLIRHAPACPRCR